MDNVGNKYRLRVKVGETDFEFESPDKESIIQIGIPLLKNVYKRFDDFSLGAEQTDQHKTPGQDQKPQNNPELNPDPNNLF